jgi:hypothetical protein
VADLHLFLCVSLTKHTKLCVFGFCTNEGKRERGGTLVDEGVCGTEEGAAVFVVTGGSELVAVVDWWWWTGGGGSW